MSNTLSMKVSSYIKATDIIINNIDKALGKAEALQFKRELEELKHSYEYQKSILSKEFLKEDKEINEEDEVWRSIINALESQETVVLKNDACILKYINTTYELSIKMQDELLKEFNYEDNNFYLDVTKALEATNKAIKPLKNYRK
ncbi:hypothetical protein SAMN02745196_00500 [Clostridium collagenovorans DSM 3089]|uniref:Uncharacterized protein n=1 Tax=Clostridium collagenovorans DSM 3089 TaxID=1121306 RepID=A0A1M5TAJ9_9CLOT|nr:hypothetical protein [Clostridium collagenovorans]SHH47807.1 hypothetical protein SAMN02745196_00500 [Clostridium collagenovorans DSM 3089]